MKSNRTNLSHPRLLSTLMEGEIVGKNFEGRKRLESVKDLGFGGYTIIILKK